MTILIAGDYYPGIINNKESIVRALSNVECFCSSSDYSIINFESPITSEWDKPIGKCGPALKSSEEAAIALKDIGFNCVSLANNHVLDQGSRTLLFTIDKFNEIGLDVVGAGDNLIDAKKILYTDIKKETLAIINCCENEFSIATEHSPGANPLNPIQQFYSIKEAKQKADFVLMIVHGGHEHYQLPSPRMQDLYRYYIDCGADVIINHHQHCYSGFEFYKGKPIVYGLGNFLFDGGTRHSGGWNEGYMVKVDMQKDDITVDCIPYYQCKNNFSVKPMSDKTDFQSKLVRLNNIIANRTLLNQKHDEWAKENARTYRNACIPYHNKFLFKAATMGLIPNGLERDHILQMLNYIQCEAHRDLLVNFLKSQVDNSIN